ncbi:MAG: type II toxin-antitoxin system VapC family toxin [Devosia sp.]
MSYILDTNVVSETRKRRASPFVLEFLKSINGELTYISVLTLGELRRGVVGAEVASPEMAAEFLQWLLDIEQDFADTTCEITAEIAYRWGEITVGRTRPAIDSLIAATALVNDFTVVTRNVRDYRELGLRVINPWTA